MRRRAPRKRKSPAKYQTRQYRVVCCVCGLELKVPVAPPPGQKLTCMKCLNESKMAAGE